MHERDEFGLFKDKPWQEDSERASRLEKYILDDAGIVTITVL